MVLPLVAVEPLDILLWCILHTPALEIQLRKEKNEEGRERRERKEGRERERNKSREVGGKNEHVKK